MSGILLATSYLASNLLLNLLNKLVLGVYGFPFPVLLTMAHMAVSYVVLTIVLTRNSHASSWGTLAPGVQRQLLAIGVCMASSTAMNNMSLQFIPLSLNQIIR